MKTPLVQIEIKSVYRKQGERVLLPERMARCTPDTHKALVTLGAEVEAHGGKLYLSDLFRSYDMQLQAHLDYTSGKKKAYSPPPGGSLHEAGRAFDLDLDSLKVPLAEFWKIAAKHAVYPILKTPDASASEAWHFSRRGSHQVIYDYYSSGKGTNVSSPYRAMAMSSILAVGVPVDYFGSKQNEAALQGGLIRLGHTIGNLDGQIGMKTRGGLEAAGVAFSDTQAMLLAVEHLLQQKYPEEYQIVAAGHEEQEIPAHLIP